MVRLLPLVLLLLLPSLSVAELKFEPATVDLGDVKTGQVFPKTAKVTNLGRQKITIRELKSTCGCIRPTFKPNELDPDGVGTLELTINTLGSNPGPNVYRIQIRYQEGSREAESTFLVTAHVRQEVTVNPATLTVFGDRLVKQKLEVKDKRNVPLKIKKAEGTHPNIVATVEPLPPGASLETAGVVTLEIKPGWQPGRHEHDVVLYTNDEQNPVLRVQVSIVSRPKSRFAASPILVTLSSQSEANASLEQRKVVLRDTQFTGVQQASTDAANGQNIQITKFEVSTGVMCTVQSQSPGSTILLISLDPEFPVKGPKDAEVRVHIQGEPAPVKILVNID